MYFLKRPSNKFKFKKEELKKIKKLKKKKEYVKQQNINLSTMNEKTIINLQNRIGNKQTLILLKELGDMGLLTKEEMLSNSTTEGELFPYLSKNEYMETQLEIKNFKKLSRMNNHSSTDAVRSGRFSVDHNKLSKPNLNNNDIPKFMKGLMGMVIYFRGYDPRRDIAEEKVKVDEKIVDPKDKKIRSEIDVLMKMIGRLPDLNEREENIESYMKVLNFLVNSGCNLSSLFDHNGNVNKQKEIIFNGVKGE